MEKCEHFWHTRNIFSMQTISTIILIEVFSLLSYYTNKTMNPSLRCVEKLSKYYIHTHKNAPNYNCYHMKHDRGAHSGNCIVIRVYFDWSISMFIKIHGTHATNHITNGLLSLFILCLCFWRGARLLPKRLNEIDLSTHMLSVSIVRCFLAFE